MAAVITYFFNLNFFESSDPAHQHDEHEHRSNILATRFSIIIFGTTVFTLILALWLTPQISKVTLQYPTQDQFKSLPLDAQCPCSQISLSYGQFVSIETTFHQVCSSDFVSDRWIKSIFYGSDSTNFYRADFRVIGSAQFLALASLCNLTKASVFQSLTSFNMTLMISPYILPQSVVQSQAETSINQFQLITADTFVKQLEFVRMMIIGNQLLSALETNIYPLYAQADTGSLQLADYMVYDVTNNSYCDCQLNVDCQVPSGIFIAYGSPPTDIFFINNISLLMGIDGFSAGCMPMDSILQSTLQCFYNQTCLNGFLSFLSTNETFTAMNMSKESRFKKISTVKELVTDLMVEEWITNISYEKYYAQCAPIICTYSKVNRHDFVYVLTKIISLLGGLTLAIKFIVPVVVQFIRRKKDNEPTPEISCMYHRV
jgi:hypothetical protein